ncbi:hypothetical protein GALL_377700 [mine drainage metagenome]|uniref:Uncharacterized protein n=1 Tax=mine drainage metagenome TaxID=410659 RepID=A0A1J5QSK8_9ZZZZ
MAAGHHHAATRAEVVGGEVHHGGRDHADVDDVDAGFADAARQGRCELRSGEPAVVTDDDAGLVACRGLAADGLADRLDDVRGEGFADDAADVVSLEDLFG